VKGRLAQVDKLSLTLGRYVLPNRESLAVLTALWALLGVVLPLAILSFSEVKISSFVTILVIVATLVFAILDVDALTSTVQEKPTTWASYIKERGYAPILDELKRQEPNVNYYGIVSSRYIAEALASGQRDRFAHEVVTPMDVYLKEIHLYDAEVERFNAAVVASIRTDATLGPLAADYPTKEAKQSVALSPYQFITEDQPFRELLAGLEAMVRASQGDIAFETIGFNWRHGVLRIPGDKIYQDISGVKAGLERVRVDIRSTQTAKNVIHAKKTVKESINRLEEALRRALSDEGGN
jgi:hypothetical protein